MTVTEPAAELFSDSYWKNPYPTYDFLRAEQPVHEATLPEGGTAWLVTRYEDVKAAFLDARLSKDYRWTLPEEMRAAAPIANVGGGAMMILTDPPDHTRLRKLVVKAFTVRRINGLRPGVEAIAERLLDELSSHVVDGRVDLLDHYAVSLPVEVICELLGVPAADRPSFSAWSATMVDENPQSDKHEAGANLGAYLSELIERKRAEPDGALLSALIEVSDSGDRLSPGELVAMAMMLLIAGHETTANLIGNGMLGLLTHPEQRDRLLADPALLPAAVEEFLRWDSPVHNAPIRFAAEDVRIGDAVIPAGAMVILSTGSANRDSDKFADPSRLDPDRDTSGHLSFGHGLHFCLGASLARMEGQVAIGALLRRFPAISLAVPAQDLLHRRSTLVHGLRELPVHL
ncbi:cytochrome P450 [Fodinicola feengrottensis]|uniref:Cytochrome P450 n=1 Tax=Fodinicola feengrottensis TaxID=435914 RepID=A0ABN2HNF6_9ACTN